MWKAQSLKSQKKQSSQRRVRCLAQGAKRLGHALQQRHQDSVQKAVLTAETITYFGLGDFFCPKFCVVFTNIIKLLMTVLKVSATILGSCSCSRLHHWRWTSGDSNRKGFQNAKRRSAPWLVQSPALGTRLARLTSGVPHNQCFCETFCKTGFTTTQSQVFG